MNALIDPLPTAQPDSDWLQIPSHGELIFSSPNHLVDVPGRGVAFPVLKVQAPLADVVQGPRIYPAQVTWVLPEGKPAGQVQLELIQIDGSVTALTRCPLRAAWVSTLVVGGRRKQSLSKPAYEAWGAELSDLTLVGRVRAVELAPGVTGAAIIASMLSKAMCLIADTLDNETDGRVQARFTVQDCDEAMSPRDELLESGHAARGERRQIFAELGFVAAGAADPARFGAVDCFVGDYPEVFLVPRDHVEVYPPESPQLPANPLQIEPSGSLKATDRELLLTLDHGEWARPTLHVHECAPGTYLCKVSWELEDTIIGVVDARLVDVTGGVAQPLARTPELANWLSTIAHVAEGKHRFRPQVQAAWNLPSPEENPGALLIGRVSRVDLDRACFRFRTALEMLMLSIGMIRSFVAERTLHQCAVQFAVDESIVVSPEDGAVVELGHPHMVEVARRFAAMGFVEGQPMVQNLFQPRGLLQRLERPRTFVIPATHETLRNAGVRTLH